MLPINGDELVIGVIYGNLSPTSNSSGVFSIYKMHFAEERLNQFAALKFINLC